MEHLITRYGPAGVFLGAAMEGQTAVILAGLLARQHLMPIWLGVASACAGSAVADHLLFVAGRSFRSHRFVVGLSRQAAFSRALRFIERYPVAYILVFRFIYGLRLASPVALGFAKVNAWLFAVLNVMGALIWAAAFVAVGYLFGETVRHLLGRHEAGRWTLILAVAVIGAAAVFALARRLRRTPNRGS